MADRGAGGTACVAAGGSGDGGDTGAGSAVPGSTAGGGCGLGVLPVPCGASWWGGAYGR